ncbi:Uncharacterised protein [Serratia proteamaculans]|nr:Uncharacterised protein [Serratia proteamaculans]
MNNGLAFLIAWYIAIMYLMLWGLIDSCGIKSFEELRAGFVKYSWPVVKRILASMFIFLAAYNLLSVFVVPV